VADAAVLYLRLVTARVRSQVQYRLSFFLDFFGAVIVGFLDFAAILIIFDNVPQLGGWSVSEVALLYAISGIAFSLTDVVIGHLPIFLPEQIRTGNFDLILLRPRGSLLQVLTADFQLRRLGKAAQAAAVLVYALARLDVDWTVGRVLMLPVAIVSAAFILAGVWIIAMCIVFWAIEGRETANAFTDGGQFLAQYPINIYERWLRRLLAFVVPMAFVSYYPALYIIGKPDPLGAPSWLRFAGPLVAVIVCATARVVWRFALRHYRGAGG
jgi:ABC-2 type transport system permease protein